MFRALASFLSALSRIPGLGFLGDISNQIYSGVSRVDSVKNDMNRIKSTAQDLKNNTTGKTG